LRAADRADHQSSASTRESRYVAKSWRRSLAPSLRLLNFLLYNRRFVEALIADSTKALEMALIPRHVTQKVSMRKAARLSPTK